MKTFAFLLLASCAAVSQALSGHNNGGSHLHGRTVFGLARREHRQLARSLSPSTLVRRHRASLNKRKTPLGADDSVTEPSNLSAGSFGADKGCTCWHTVSAGEVCLGLIDKSTAGFDITKFHEFNPQVDADCTNLEDGQAYCVDNGANEGAATNNQANTAAPKQLASTTTTDTSSADEEDCEDPADDGDGLDDPIDDSGESIDDQCDDDDSEDTSEDADEEDCEENDSSETDTQDTTDASADVSVTVQKKPSVAEKKPATTTTSEAAAPSETSGSGDGGAASGQFQGTATWYEQNGNPGACGAYKTDKDLIVALPPSVYANGAHCKQQVKLTSTKTGNTVIATAMDLCPSCPGSNIDCSVELFNQLSNNDQGAGVLDVKWDLI